MLTGSSTRRRPVPPKARRPRTGARLPRLDARYAPMLGTFVVLVAILGIGGVRYDNFLSGAVISNLFINNTFLIVSPWA